MAVDYKTDQHPLFKRKDPERTLQCVNPSEKKRNLLNYREQNYTRFFKNFFVKHFQKCFAHDKQSLE